MLRSGQFSDLTLVCQGKEFKIHKVVACPQSPVFSAAVSGEFKESQTGVIEIELFDSETVRRMVEFLYTGNYDCNQPQEQNTDTLTHVRVNAIADYYGIHRLTLLANQKIQQVYQDKWNAKAFLASTREALDNTGDKKLHSVMALLAAQHLEELMASSKMADLVGDFAAEVLRYHALKFEATKQEQHQKAAVLATTQAAEAKTARVIANIDRLVTTMCDREYCRNTACEMEFGCHIEKLAGDEPNYVLRCSYCRCRH
ncbi:uncharacterized protein TRIVIDRAFT_54366 [Trichoderma virens Gv29-8]|uniref:BTB domain-containing protein n=1 Tax=Hypocrea virens (strain Gv29-8 / FGSC 10586) TaxID=413071 RepID=G9MLQ3_HYPVG|nr:uncharacterized protein TRIVIDRAFT_54366 [Trichoderma virens Gv29-8]EHK24280.1 hypothetical protein TRIVIDRAFT_54366 [Trichoderma virens Gv29-8]